VLWAERQRNGVESQYESPYLPSAASSCRLPYPANCRLFPPTALSCQPPPYLTNRCPVLNQGGGWTSERVGGDVGRAPKEWRGFGVRVSISYQPPPYSANFRPILPATALFCQLPPYPANRCAIINLGGGGTSERVGGDVGRKPEEGRGVTVRVYLSCQLPPYPTNRPILPSAAITQNNGFAVM